MITAPKLRALYTSLFSKSVRAKLESRISGQYPKVFDRKKFIFIHIPKTAGKSLGTVLGIRGARHLKYSQYEELLGEIISEYYIFTIIRDPVDRLKSAYTYMSAGGNQSIENINFRNRWLKPYPTLQKFVEEALEQPEVRSMNNFQPQIEFIKTKSGKIADDINLLKFEKLSTEMHRLPEKLLNKQEIPHHNASIRNQENLLLDTKAMQKVIGFYHSDYAMLNAQTSNELTQTLHT